MIGLHVLPLREKAGRLKALRLLPGPGQPYHPYSGRVQTLMDLKVANELRLAREHALVVAAESIARAVEPLGGQVDAALQEVANLAVELGLSVAREVVGNAADRGDVDLVPVVKDCLERAVRAPGESEVVLKLHPEDVPLITAELGDRAEKANAAVAARLAPDPAVQRGEVVVETGIGRLVCDPREVLERLTGSLRQELHRDLASSLAAGMNGDGAAPPGSDELPPEAPQ